MSSQFFIVWNENRDEGFVTNDREDANFVVTGWCPRRGVSTAGQAFRDAYTEDGDVPHTFTLEEVTLPVDLSLRCHNCGNDVPLKHLEPDT